MSTHDSKLFSGFYKRTVDERRALIADFAGVDANLLASVLDDGGVDVPTADKLIENVLGRYAFPFAVGVQVLMNGQLRVAPMVVEEPSVVAAASGAAKIVARAGGFHAEADSPVMISQVQLDQIKDVDIAVQTIEAARVELIEEGNRVIPRMVARGGGLRQIQVRRLADDELVVHLLIDCQDAMGANLVNTVAEHLGPKLAAMASARLGLRILSNLADHRLVRVSCEVPVKILDHDNGGLVADAIERASLFAERDPYRASTHNKGIMNGIDPVLLATGNDWRAVEAGAHAYAARSGRYTALATWRSEAGVLRGQIELPMAVGTVGGTLGQHRAAQLALRLARVEGAQDLGMLAASVGLASNLAALKALGTEGIQRGHMSLHARSVALSVGAQGDEVELVSAQIASLGRVDRQTAADVLTRVRKSRDS